MCRNGKQGEGLGSRMEIRAGWRDLETPLQYKFLHAVHLLFTLCTAFTYIKALCITVEYGLNYAVDVFFIILAENSYCC